MNPKKLAIITSIDATFKVLLMAQIKAAQKAGYEVYGVCTEGPSFDYLESQGINMFPVEIKRFISPFSDLKALWRMYRFLKTEKIDIVHTHTPKPSLLGQLAAKLASVPVIVNTVHGFYFHDNMKRLPRFFFLAMEWIAAKCSTVILSQNPEDIETAVRLKFCKRQKMKLLGNGVDIEKFSPERFVNNFKVQKRKEIGVPQDAVVIGIIGRLVKEKGFLELFQAFREIMKIYDHVWLVIIGPEEPEKPDRISGYTFREYGIAERTVWLGGKEPDQVPGLLACCDIYALPSWREGFPRSAIEASVMGIPVVATDIRGCRQVVDHGKTGFLVELRNIGALKQALCQLVESRALREEMGKSACDKAKHDFNEKRVCRIVLETYEQCLGK